MSKPITYTPSTLSVGLCRKRISKNGDIILYHKIVSIGVDGIIMKHMRINRGKLCYASLTSSWGAINVCTIYNYVEADESSCIISSSEFDTAWSIYNV